MCRPGRLDKLLYVDLPSATERAEIVRTMICRRKMPLSDDTSLSAIETLVRDKCDGYSGADLAALVREAGVCALKKVLEDTQATSEMDGGDLTVGLPEFENALSNLGPSVSPAQRRKYEALRSKFAGLPVKASKILVDDSKDEEKVA